MIGATIRAEGLESRCFFAAAPQNLVLGGTGNVTVLSTAALPDGSFFAGGFFSGKIDFQPTGGHSLNATALDGFIARYTEKFKLLWLYPITGKTNQTVNAVAYDSLGKDIVYAGAINDKTSVPIGNTSQSVVPTGLGDMIEGRVDLNGMGLRVREFGGSDKTHSFVFPNSVSVSPTGDATVSGQFEGPIDFDPETAKDIKVASNTKFSGFVDDLTGKDHFRWCDTLIGTKGASVAGTAWNSHNFIAMAGYVVGQNKFQTPGDGTLGVDGGLNKAAYVAVLDQNGDETYFNVLPGKKNVAATAVNWTNSKTAVVTGTYDDNVALDSKGKFMLHPVVGGSSTSTFIAQYNMTGGLVSDFALGASQALVGRILLVLPNNRVVVLGDFQGDANLGRKGKGGLVAHSTVGTFNGTQRATDDIFGAAFDLSTSKYLGAQTFGTSNDDHALTAFSMSRDLFLELDFGMVPIRSKPTELPTPVRRLQKIFLP